MYFYIFSSKIERGIIAYIYEMHSKASGLRALGASDDSAVDKTVKRLTDSMLII